ncbi:MAG: GTP cyclohydrolase II [Myxococcota bacterium]
MTEATHQNVLSFPSTKVRRYSQCVLPTEFGEFDVAVFRDGDVEHLAISSGDVRRAEVLTRVHSECLTGEVLHSLKCDCREQLHHSLKRIAAEGGVVLYLRQEGRGIGLGNKIAAYEKQQEGYDTVDANRVLGFGDDLRTFEMVPAMLEDLGVQSVVLMTNNPLKVEGLRSYGIDIVRREPHLLEPHALNRGYLDAKRKRMRHLIDASDLE